MRVRKKPNPIEKTCMDCGVTFIAYSINALRCEKCRKERAREHSREYMAQTRELNKPQVESKKPKKKILTFSQILHITEVYNKIHHKYMHYGDMVNIIENTKSGHCVCCGASVLKDEQICPQCERMVK